MPIRDRIPYGETDLSQGLQDVLRRNGIQAHISFTPDSGYKLIVLGHDSPVLEYKLNRQQMESLMAWGSTYANKNAYNTFASIVKNDFYMPEGYVSASNAFGRVNMGLHGIRLKGGDYGMPFFSPFHRHSRGWGGDFVAWAPRTQGFHLRRIGGHPYVPWGGGAMVADDGRRVAGRQNPGGYGFYYKGQQRQNSPALLDEISVDPRINELKAAPRPKGAATPYSQAIVSDTDVYFNKNNWKEVLASHGLVIDEKSKQLIVQSDLTKVDLQYDLTDEELKQLTENKISKVSVDKRLETINNIIKDDFVTPVTKDMLESKNLVALDLKPEVREVVEARFIEREKALERQQIISGKREEMNGQVEEIRNNPNGLYGRDIQAIMGNKGWFQPVKDGRVMNVSAIEVRQRPDSSCYMCAEINGKWVTHEISKKDYNKFIDLDDEHRLKMFDKIFKEVEIKSAKGQNLYQDRVVMATDGKTAMTQDQLDNNYANSRSVNGSVLQNYNEKKGFYRERAHGREVEVDSITVNEASTGKYKMTAVINGKAITHDISQKDYNKFLAVDDYHRVQLFAKIFDEVDIKTRPGEGVNVGAAILAALVVTGETVAAISDVRNSRGQGRPYDYTNTRNHSSSQNEEKTFTANTEKKTNSAPSIFLEKSVKSAVVPDPSERAAANFQLVSSEMATKEPAIEKDNTMGRGV